MHTNIYNFYLQMFEIYWTYIEREIYVALYSFSKFYFYHLKILLDYLFYLLKVYRKPKKKNN